MHPKACVSRRLLVVWALSVILAGTGLPASAAQPTEVKVETGLWKINLDPAFSTQALSVIFNQANTGTKKIDKGSQVLAVKIGILNNGTKQIGVRPMDFSVNDQEQDLFVVKEENRTPSVVNVDPGKGVFFFNYYIVPDTVKKLEDIKLVYTGIDENYAKKKVLIPLVVKKK